MRSYDGSWQHSRLESVSMFDFSSHFHQAEQMLFINIPGSVTFLILSNPSLKNCNQCCSLQRLREMK